MPEMGVPCRTLRSDRNRRDVCCWALSGRYCGETNVRCWGNSDRASFNVRRPAASCSIALNICKILEIDLEKLLRGGNSILALTRHFRVSYVGRRIIAKIFAGGGSFLPPRASSDTPLRESCRILLKLTWCTLFGIGSGDCSVICGVLDPMSDPNSPRGSSTESS